MDEPPTSATASALGVDAREVALGYATQSEIDVSEDRSLLASMQPRLGALTIEQAQAVARLIHAFSVSAGTASPLQGPPIDISSFTTAERRQITNLVLELGDRGRAAGSEGLTALASPTSSG